MLLIFSILIAELPHQIKQIKSSLQFMSDNDRKALSLAENGTREDIFSYWNSVNGIRESLERQICELKSIEALAKLLIENCNTDSKTRFVTNLKRAFIKNRTFFCTEFSPLF